MKISTNSPFFMFDYLFICEFEVGAAQYSQTKHPNCVFMLSLLVSSVQSYINSHIGDQDAYIFRSAAPSTDSNDISLWEPQKLRQLSTQYETKTKQFLLSCVYTILDSSAQPSRTKQPSCLESAAPTPGECYMDNFHIKMLLHFILEEFVKKEEFSLTIIELFDI